MKREIAKGVTDIHMYCIHNLCLLADEQELDRDSLINMFWHLMRDMCREGSYKHYELDYKAVEADENQKDN